MQKEPLLAMYDNHKCPLEVFLNFDIKKCIDDEESNWIGCTMKTYLGKIRRNTMFQTKITSESLNNVFSELIKELKKNLQQYPQTLNSHQLKTTVNYAGSRSTDQPNIESFANLITAVEVSVQNALYEAATPKEKSSCAIL